MILPPSFETQAIALRRRLAPQDEVGESGNASFHGIRPSAGNALSSDPDFCFRAAARNVRTTSVPHIATVPTIVGDTVRLDG